jgi:hypothetical protein
LIGIGIRVVLEALWLRDSVSCDWLSRLSVDDRHDENAYRFHPLLMLLL